MASVVWYAYSKVVVYAAFVDPSNDPTLSIAAHPIAELPDVA